MMKKEILLVTGMLVLPALSDGAAPATGASLTISDVADDPACVVQLDDPENYVWILQKTSDWTSWGDVEEIKIHNGQFSLDLPEADIGSVQFFRAIYDPERQSLESTVENALLLPLVPDEYATLNLPPHLNRAQIANQDNTPVDNPVTDAGALLGRTLFYDNRLSTNQTVSCSSCHQAEHGFSDPRQFSIGFDGGLTGRNSMGLTSARYYARENFFWDERAATLEEQVLQPIQNAVEMGMTLTALTNRLSAEPFYAELFESAFGTPEVTSDKISEALAQFVRSIVSSETKYDEGVASNFVNFTAEEVLGRQIFLGQVGNASCSNCHGSDNFVPGNAIFNNGLENPYVDKGVGDLTGLAQDEGLFKVPSLRNIALTAPYMHDGRFSILEEVVEFYNSGVVDHPNLSPQLRNPPAPGPGPRPTPRRLNQCNAQKEELVAFLHTLTDLKVVQDPRFQDPFNYGD
jgi:cytochrome c peroxidase